jgi:hypothetical protein
MVGATTPKLVILISNLPKGRISNCLAFVQNLVIFGCQQMAKWIQTNSNLFQDTGLIILVICCVMMERVYTYNAVDKAKD